MGYDRGGWKKRGGWERRSWHVALAVRVAQRTAKGGAGSCRGGKAGRTVIVAWIAGGRRVGLER